MLSVLVVTTLLGVVALGALGYRLLARASTARSELARETHRQALRLDQRCDYQQREIDRLALRQRIDHLGDLVETGARRGLLSERTLPELRSFVLDLREESFQREIRERSTGGPESAP